MQRKNDLKILIMGMGEVGKAVYKVFREYYRDIKTRDKRHKRPHKVDILQICYGYSDEFVDITNNYIDSYSPELTIIHSTVKIGTCKKLKGNKVHCPVRGKHKILAEGIKYYPMIVGFENWNSAEFALNYFKEASIKTILVYGLEVSELMKLLSLVQFGWNIEFARYAEECCKKFNVDYKILEDYTDTYNKSIKFLESDWYKRQKYILEPPKGKIGGHCILPAIEMLNDQVCNEALQAFIEINKA